MLDFRKYDALGAEIKPGDICVRGTKSGIEPVIYRGETTANGKSTGKFGRFYTAKGKTSIRYSNVIFAFDPVGDRRNKSEEVQLLTRKFYEGTAKGKSSEHEGAKE